ncbi:hypothetical protein [uncultured Endozoicomonas sp.]|uniref:hypothetical protein n=1 Tax=uncultured Endozoicomonas sp. TaxID=432652 RepID=UPI002630803C|nr:hypothetical protein [uncultured Endozoicomonas sp.]
MKVSAETFLFEFWEQQDMALICAMYPNLKQQPKEKKVVVSLEQIRNKRKKNGRR